MLGANSRTVHFFRFKNSNKFIDLKSETDEKGATKSLALSSFAADEEETKIGLFFKKLKDKVLPPALTFEKSNLRIYMDKKLTEDLPYLIFPSNNSTLIVRI